MWWCFCFVDLGVPVLCVDTPYSVSTQSTGYQRRVRGHQDRQSKSTTTLYIMSSTGNLKSQFEQKIKDAAPKKPKASWRTTGNSGGVSGEGKFKKSIKPEGAPPPPKSLTDLP
eukprot:TRINITY_DN3762_c0_g1_i2.p1 TRINITY_DN3762_c0_g1~~TRINITY_DN3762_c0_g1_i2.p1  ORF type:complete len:113 (-),score=9.78 TRINITY_DN3762_c0_g1_i2:129-467(-)